MLNVDLAFRKLAALATPVAEIEDVVLADAVGRVSAADVPAPIDLPPFDSSAMDGFAVNAEGLDFDGQKRFEVIDRSLAGRPASKTIKGSTTAIRVFTGAVMPRGSDAVVVQEEVAVDGGIAHTEVRIRTEQNVRRRGQDVRRGDLVCRSGTHLTAYRLTWLAACGIESVPVKRRVRVAVFSTGDELADAGTPLAEGQIYDSNRFALLTLLREKAVDTMDMGRLPDRSGRIRDALERAAARADILVTSGGVSVGTADYVKSVVEDMGNLDFWRVALKPGKPLAVGRIGDALFFGLPGNPVSTIVTYLLFVAPAIDLLGGLDFAPPMMLPAVLDGDIKHSRGRREYVRGILRTKDGELRVTATGDQHSNRLATFADANCLIVVDDDHGDLHEGDQVSAIVLPGVAAHPFREGVP